VKPDFFTLGWLVGDALKHVSFSEEGRSWVLTFTSGSSLAIECLWRLKSDGVLVGTSEDHGHKFGLPAPFDAGAVLMERTLGLRLSSIHVGSGTADLRLSFSPDIELEVLPTSAGYESWHAVSVAGGVLHALGSGELCGY
jgi:hypothetical protein